MFERFTVDARRALTHAQTKARELHHNYIGTEHVLIGLIDDIDETMAKRLLHEAGVTYEKVLAEVKRIVGQGDEVVQGNLPFTPRTKRVLELALREALSDGCNYIGTEHILFAIARDGEGVANRILLDLDVDLKQLREALATRTGRTGPRADEIDPEAEIDLANITRAQDATIAQISKLTARLERLRARERELRGR